MSTIGLSSSSFENETYVKDILGSDFLKRVIVNKKWYNNKNLIEYWQVSHQNRFDFNSRWL